MNTVHTRKPRAVPIVVCLLLLTVFALPAYANQPPGPQVVLAEVLILPIMMLLTTLGGGYAILRSRPTTRRGVKPVLAVVIILLSGMHEMYGLLVALVFGALAIVRGFQMIYWGILARQTPPGSARPAASTARLISAGAVLIVLAGLLAGLSVAFVGWWPSEEYVERDLRRVVAYELAHFEHTKGTAGKGSFLVPATRESDSEPFPDGPYLMRIRFGRPGSYYDSEFKLTGGGEGFEVYAWPRRMPIFPYNYLVTLPSFYANESGQIRVIRVHRGGERCPPGAPVFARVQAGDWQRIQ